MNTPSPQMQRYLQSEATAATKAEELFNAGFGSKTAQKDAIRSVTRAYESLCDAVRQEMLERRAAHFRVKELSDEEIAALRTNEEYFFFVDKIGYWDLPALHHVKPKHDHLFSHLDGALDRVRVYADLRAAMASSEIRPPVKKNEADKITEYVRKSISDLMALRKEQFVTGMDITARLNEYHGCTNSKAFFVPVTATAHYVHGHKGTVFLRTFYYLGGRLTPLNTIIAIIEQTAENLKEAERNA